MILLRVVLSVLGQWFCPEDTGQYMGTCLIVTIGEGLPLASSGWSPGCCSISDSALEGVMQGASRLRSHVINHSQAGDVTRGWGGGGVSVTDKRLRFGFMPAGEIMTVATASTVY